MHFDIGASFIFGSSFKVSKHFEVSTSFEVLTAVCTLRFVPALNLVTGLTILPMFTFLTSIASQEGNSVLVLIVFMHWTKFLDSAKMSSFRSNWMCIMTNRSCLIVRWKHFLIKTAIRYPFYHKMLLGNLVTILTVTG